jgi:hypothetical protein
MLGTMSVSATSLIVVAFLLVAVVIGFLVGPKWWHWGSFFVLTVVLFIPLMMAFFIPLPMVIILNVAISHKVWLRKQGSQPVKGATATR